MVRGGTVVDATGARRADVRVSGGAVVEVGEGLDVPAGATVLDAGGCVVAPGLVDLHTHLREPGREEAETVGTGTRAAALGGFTAVVAMPNTDPPLDSAESVRNVFALAEGAMAQVAVAGAITVGRAGERLAPMAELAALGVRLFTDDGDGVQSAGLMRRALQYATRPRRGPGPALRGPQPGRRRAPCTRGSGRAGSGCPAMPAEAEEVMVARDIALSRATGGRVHFLHLSTAGSIDLVRRARAEGVPVTAEVAPHHFTLTDGCTSGYDPVFKVNPPLRPQDDVDAVKTRPGRRHGRRHRHRPRPPRPGAEGPAVRPGAPGHARAPDGPGPGRDRARPAARADPGPAQLAAGRHRHARPGPRRQPRAARWPRGRAANLWSSTRRPPGRSTRPRWPRGAATPPTPAAR